MKIAVFGTGDVGRRLAGKLAELGHTVTLGSRTHDNATAAGWAAETGGRHGTFAEAAADSELIVNATSGLVSVAALTAAGAENLRGKVIVDVANPMDFSGGMPPRVPTFEGGVSLAEEIQRTFPETRVVKTLNTVNNSVMVRPSLVPGDHNVFVSGDDAEAKAVTSGLLQEFGWRPGQIIDLGGLATARPIEQYVAFWVVLYGAVGPGDFNISVTTAAN